MKLCKERLYITMLLIQLLYLINIMLSIDSYRKLHIRICRADCLIVNNDVIILGLLIIPLIAISMLEELSFFDKKQLIVKYQTYGRIAGEKMKVLLKFAAIFTVYQFCSSYIWSLLMSNQMISWDKPDGAVNCFYNSVCRMGFASVAMLYLITLFFTIFINLLIVLIFNELNIKWLGIGSIVILALAGYNMKNTEFLISPIALQYRHLVRPDRIYLICAGYVAVTVFLMLINYLIIKNKEYTK